MDALARDIRLLPKAHLHVHLEGAMRRETVLELSERHGLLPPRLEGDGSFAAFVEMYRAASSLLTSPDDYRRVVFEVAQDAADAGAVWVEPAVWLTAAQSAKLGLPDEQATLEMLIDAAERAQATLGIGVGFIVQANRTRPPDEAVALGRLASRYAGRGVVAFGLADDEARAGPEPFAEAFAMARSAGLISAPHAGELAGAASVAAALDRLRAQRIQHGVRAIEDPRLIARLARDGVCLDVCPTSNLMLGVVRSLEAHPLTELLEAGVAVSINSDDPLFFQSGLADEYALCRSEFGLADGALARIAECSIRASGAPEVTKRAATAGIDQWLASEAG